MEKLKLRTRAGWRDVSTVDIGPAYNKPYETIVWGGKRRDRIAYMERHEDVETARRRHREIADNVLEIPDSYRLN